MKNKLFSKRLSGICVGLFLVLSTAAFAQPRLSDISGTTEISVELACKLTLIQGNGSTITITGDNDVLEDVRVKQMGSKLRILNENHHQNKKDVEITITLPELNELSITGAVDLVTPNQFKATDLTIEVSGVANFDLLLKSDQLKIDASGVIGGTIKGVTKNLNIDISGVGKLDATGLESNNCKADVSGVAKISLNVSEDLEASVSGMGKINYKGNPHINANSSGIGRISKL